LNLSNLLETDARLSARLALVDRPGAWRTLASVLAHSGDSPLWVAGLGLLWWLGDAAWKHAALAALIGVLVTAGVVFVLKFAIRRPRPPGEWGAMYRRLDAHSFPSGHAARMAMLAVVALAFAPPGWAALLVVWAVLVMLARVAMQVHYLSDVAGGALVGIVTGVAIAATFSGL
jgi:membrane-associated phospholipid phosphatase